MHTILFIYIYFFLINISIQVFSKMSRQNVFQNDPVCDIHKKEYIDDLAQVTVLHGLFKNVEDAMAEAKAFAKMVICAGVNIDSIPRGEKYRKIPNIFYE